MTRFLELCGKCLVALIVLLAVAQLLALTGLLLGCEHRPDQIFNPVIRDTVFVHDTVTVCPPPHHHRD